MYGQGQAGIQGGALIQTQAAMAPTPISPMQQARNALQEAVMGLHDRLTELDRRMGTALRPATPSKPEGDGTMQSGSELRDYLLNQARGVEGANARIEDILNRLEL